MIRIGIDFGTTNSTIAYFDESRRQITGHRFGGPSGSEYLPSAIAYPKKDGDSVLIGYEAQGSNHANYFNYELYKLALLTDYQKRLNGEHGKPVIEVVKEYLHLLIKRFKEEYFSAEKEKQSSKLEYIVLALPNTVFEDQIKQAKEIKADLKEFLDSEAESSEFCAEAACACEFYISKPEMKGFRGNIVVIDYGGGTLDISNCSVAGNDGSEDNIHVIAQRGTSADEKSAFGFAGAAFDKDLVCSIPEIGSLNLPKDELNEYTRDFERGYKIPFYKAIRDGLEKYYIDGIDQALTWKLSSREQYTFNVSLLDNAFQKANFGFLKDHFDTIVPQNERANGGAASQDTFRVLLIGGFSQLLCVERAVKNFLSIDLTDFYDKRIPQISMQEKFIAVAYGAALCANKRSVEPLSTISLFEIGVKYFDGQILQNEILVKENFDLKLMGDNKWGNSYLIQNAGKASVNIYCRTSVSGERVKRFDISGVCSDNCTVRLCVIAKGNAYKLRIQNESNNSEKEFDFSDMIAEYKNRNGG